MRFSKNQRSKLLPTNSNSSRNNNNKVRPTTLEGKPQENSLSHRKSLSTRTLTLRHSTRRVEDSNSPALNRASLNQSPFVTRVKVEVRTDNEGHSPSPHYSFAPSRTTLFARAQVASPTVWPVGAHLSNYWQTWERLGVDPWIVSVVRWGFGLTFKKRPPLSRTPLVKSARPNNPIMNNIIQDQFNNLLQKDAIEVVQDPSTPGFYSLLFVVPKKSGTWRPIIDLSVLNTYLIIPKFKMETPSSIREGLHIGGWTTSIDLTDAYFHIPIHPDSRKFLRMEFQGTVYQFKALPFGLSTSPWIFTKVMAAVKKLLHLHKIVLFQYLDDWLIEALARNLAQNQTQQVLNLCNNMGLIVNEDKSELTPSQDFVFVGVHYNLQKGLVYPTQENLTKIQLVIEIFLQALTLPAIKWQSLIGTLSAQDRVIPWARLHIRPFQFHLQREWNQQSGDQHQLITIPQQLRTELLWWKDLDNLTTGLPLHNPNFTKRIFTDASNQGWGGHFQGQNFQGLWKEEDKLLHINVLEMRAIREVLQLIELQQGEAILIATDNTTVVSYINRMGGTRSWSLWKETKELFNIAVKNNLTLKARHIPGRLNVIADQLSREGLILLTEWSLHQEVADALFEKWGQPNLDLFATRYNNKCRTYVSPVPDSQAWEVDALAIDWEGISAYAYPPQQILSQVLTKFQNTQNCRLIIVAPWWPIQAWFPILNSLAIQPPIQLPQWDKLLKQPRSDLYHNNVKMLNLHAWLLQRGL